MSDSFLPLTFTSHGSAVAGLKIGAGSPLVIVHGLGGHKEDFQTVMTALAGSRTVYAFDMIGFGASDRGGPTNTIAMQVEAIRSLLDSEGIGPVDLVGNSLGGWICASFAAAAPELVRKLILIDAAGLKVTLSGPPPVNFAPDTLDDMHKLLSVVIASDFAHSDAFASQALAAFKASGEAETLGKLFSGFASPDSKDRLLDFVLPEVKAPTLVVWGAEDGLFPAALADVVVAALPPGAQKVLIPGASHFPQIDKPSELSKVIADFLG